MLKIILIPKTKTTDDHTGRFNLNFSIYNLQFAIYNLQFVICNLI